MCIVTIPYFDRINHLFQNGRALLKCQIFLPPTLSAFPEEAKPTTIENCHTK
jgi:hypothetical protein